MSETETKVHVSTETARSKHMQATPLEGLRRQIDHLLDDFQRGYWHLPFRLAWVQFKWLEWCRRWLDSYDPLRRSPAELYEHLASTNDYTSIDEWAGVT